MKPKLKRINIIIFSLLATALLVLNLFLTKSIVLGFIFGTFYIIAHGYYLGLFTFPYERDIFKIWFGSLLLLAGTAFAGSVTYYLYELNNFTIAFLAAKVSVALIIVSFFFKPAEYIIPAKDRHKPISKLIIILSVFLYLVLFSILINQLLEYQTAEAIRSPWDVLPAQFFITYFIATLILAALAFLNKKTIVSLFLISLHYFLTLSAALIIYKIGYGYDPFVHRATEKIIAKAGEINPKPLYYLGQYSLVVFFSKIFQTSTALIDKLLVPILSSLYIPGIIYFSISRGWKTTKRNAAFLSLIFLIIPFGAFIVTTPQSLANFFIISAIFLSLLYIFQKNISFWPLLILGLAALSIHPLAGLPLFIFLSLLLIHKKVEKPFKKIWFWPAFTLSAVIIPLVFYLNSLISKNLAFSFNKSIGQFLASFSYQGIYWQNKFNLIKDLVYTYGFNAKEFIILISLLSVIVLISKKHFKKFIPYISAFIILIINYILLKGLINFTSLIQYEQANYAQRLLQISYYFLYPLIFFAFYQLIKKIRQNPLASLKIFLCLLTAGLISVSFYFSYPKNDMYISNHSYNVSQTDIKAVRFINENANKDFIVLANQMTSAAALQEFGFKKYYTEDKIFYYPIPTSGPLYKYYSDLVYNEVSKEKISEAMNLVGANQAFFVINEYWWKFDKITEQAKKIADEWKAIDNKKIYIFKFNR